jgi:hypothetical protein
MSVVPPEYLELWHEGSDGTQTHFCGGQWEGVEGVELAYTPSGTNFQDMFESPFTTIYNSAAFQIGGTYSGLVQDMFQFALLFTIKSTNNMTFRQSWSRFRKQLAPDSDSTMHARIQGASHRTLTVRLDKTSNLKTDVDPNGQKFGQIMIFFTGAYPRWVEQDYTQSWVTAIDTTGSGTDTGSVTVWNPTTTICWIKWMAQAGNANVIWTIPDFSWGSDIWNRATADAGRLIIMPQLINGEHIAVDTNPYAFQGQVNSSLDTQVYLRMNGVQFLYPLPPNTPPTSVPVQVSKALPGNGIQVRIPMEWQHPWGME